MRCFSVRAGWSATWAKTRPAITAGWPAERRAAKSLGPRRWCDVFLNRPAARKNNGTIGAGDPSHGMVRLQAAFGGGRRARSRSSLPHDRYRGRRQRSHPGPGSTSQEQNLPPDRIQTLACENVADDSAVHDYLHNAGSTWLFRIAMLPRTNRSK